LLVASQHPFLKLDWVGCSPQLKRAVTRPGAGTPGVESEQPLDPADVRLRAGTAKLPVEFNLNDPYAERLGGVAYQFDGADFVWPDDLVLVEQEDGHSCRAEEFFDLCTIRTELFARPAVVRGITNAMRLVANQHVEVIRDRADETVEVLEQICRPGADALPE